MRLVTLINVDNLGVMDELTIDCYCCETFINS